MDQAAEEVSLTYSRSVVHVFWKTIDKDEIESTGTGFIVWTSGHHCLVVTCNHCIEGDEFNPTIHRLVVRLSGDANNDLEARRVDGDAARDIAVLHVETVDAPPPPMFFAEEVDELPRVHEDIVVALGFCVPDNDEDESEEDDEEEEDESEDEYEIEYEDPVFAYPEEPAAFPGRIIMEPLLDCDENADTFNEIYKADCGLMTGCFGGPLVYDDKVVGVATHSEIQIDRYATPRTVKAVFQKWLGLESDDERSIKELLDLLSRH